MRSIFLSLFWGASVVRSAINPDGTQAVEPVTDDDASPIADMATYYPDLHDCPLECEDLTNTNSWITYFSVERLKRCNETMLLQFSITQPLDKSDSTILIRSCSMGSSNGNDATISPELPTVENPKKDEKLYLSSLESAPACTAEGIETKDQIQIVTGDGRSNGSSSNSGDIDGVLDSMSRYFAAKDNCDESFIFAYHQQTVGAVYVGQAIGKGTVTSALQAMRDRMSSKTTVASRTVAQLCGQGRSGERSFGIAVDTTGDLVGLQTLARDLSQGKCATQGGVDTLAGVTVREVATGLNGTGVANSTVDGHASTLPLRPRHGFNRRHVGHTHKEKRAAPQPSADGTCATHLIVSGDLCSTLAVKYGVSVDDLEKWNKGKTWAWTECKEMLIGYNMCVSDGTPPLPPPQQGAECGPLVPGTKKPTDKSVSLASLNPCPLKACCSNWGFCGVFPAHCDIHAPEGGGPGTKLKDFQNTCVANCGNEIKQNSGSPAAFQRIGYYESYNFGRECLHMKAKNANTDGSYTHMHWAFGDIDPKTWKPIVNDSSKQWEDFKKLPNMKRILSLGGWAYSTEPATYNIIREAIIDNRDTFAANLAKFVQDEGIDGIDIDWEYPGAPDITVGGQPIGKKTDGLDYLKFLIVLKKALGKDKSVSIAAPASYWYLKAFPIDRIAASIDYIVYMTYDLHGQWDYGNPNAYDMCPSGKCIRSHVNLTETMNSLSMITKAGVANNKIFVGEASYGRSFHMAKDGCWGPTCDFTGTRTQSDAAPGRCTKTGGYLAYAEIGELIMNAQGVRMFYDQKSNSDIVIYNGDYISYMTDETKNTRREEWKKRNFAGSIDWAVDLQSFTNDEYDDESLERPKGDVGCVWGDDLSLDSGSLCAFSCMYGFCPESLCECVDEDVMETLPPKQTGIDVTAYDPSNVDLTRLCKWACQYGYCPDDICIKNIQEIDDGIVEVGDVEGMMNRTEIVMENQARCMIYKDGSNQEHEMENCKKVCKDKIEAAQEEGRTTNYGCMGFWPGQKTIPWYQAPGGPAMTPGRCLCDNWVLNELADTVLEALPMIAQIGCYIIMNSIKLVLDVGLQFIPGVGKALDAGLDMATTAAQMAAYLYPEEEDPEGAFNWWLSPCGGTDLVPEDIKKVFGILSQVADGVSSFAAPKKHKKGSGKKGDDGNPKDQSKPRSLNNNNNNNNNNGGSGSSKSNPKKCKFQGTQTLRMGQAKNTLRLINCNKNEQTETVEYIVKTMEYDAKAKGLPVKAHCKAEYPQACHHYSSAIRQNPSWKTLTCPPAAATVSKIRDGKVANAPQATKAWYNEHKGGLWKEKKGVKNPNFKGTCQADEFPPIYLMDNTHPAWVYAGSAPAAGQPYLGQSIRYLTGPQNSGAANTLWKGVCFTPALVELSDTEFANKVKAAPNKLIKKNPLATTTQASITVPYRPEFTIDTWGHTPIKDDGLFENDCWPEAKTPKDPGFALLSYDPWFTSNNRQPLFDYTKKYDPKANPPNGV